MLHMSEYLTSKERHTYLHLENTSHSSLLWLSQKGLVFRVLWTIQCFPPRRAQRLGWGPDCGKQRSVMALCTCGPGHA